MRYYRAHGQIMSDKPGQSPTSGKGGKGKGGKGKGGKRNAWAVEASTPTTANAETSKSSTGVSLSRGLQIVSINPPVTTNPIKPAPAKLQMAKWFAHCDHEECNGCENDDKGDFPQIGEAAEPTQAKGKPSKPTTKESQKLARQRQLAQKAKQDEKWFRDLKTHGDQNDQAMQEEPNHDHLETDDKVPCALKLDKLVPRNEHEGHGPMEKEDEAQVPYRLDGKIKWSPKLAKASVEKLCKHVMDDEVVTTSIDQMVQQLESDREKTSIQKMLDPKVGKALGLTPESHIFSDKPPNTSIKAIEGQCGAKLP